MVVDARGLAVDVEEHATVRRSCLENHTSRFQKPVGADQGSYSAPLADVAGPCSSCVPLAALAELLQRSRAQIQITNV